MKGAGAAAWPTSLVDDPVRDAEEQLNQEWWAAQDSDDDWIASHEEKHDGYDAVCR